MSDTMKSVTAFGKKDSPIQTKIETIPIPKPSDNEVLIKVEVSGTNPKDWKIPLWYDKAHNSGDDVGGYVHSVGSKVTEFKAGDRVAAFHVMMSPHGSFAEYAIVPEHTVFHIGQETSFEEAATVPLAAMTAAIGLFIRLGLPTPLNPAKEETPLLVYGGSSAVGAFAIKLAKLASIHPIITVAGSGCDLAKSVGADEIVDYRKNSVVEDVKKALNGKKLLYAYDAISEDDSLKNVFSLLDQGGKMTTVLPTEIEVPSHITLDRTYVGTSHDGPASEQDFASAYFRLFGRWMKEKRFEGHPYEVVPGGLEGVEEGLRRLQDGKVSAKKLVYKIADTPGL